MASLTEMIYSNDFADYLIPSYILNQEAFQLLSPRRITGD